MPVEYSEIPEERYVEIAVEGRVTKEDFETVVPRMEALIEQTGGDLRLVEVVRSFDGFDPSLLWKGLKFDLKHIRKFDRCAVVTDVGWMGSMTNAFSRVIPITLRTFPLDEIDAARAWARATEAGSEA